MATRCIVGIVSLFCVALIIWCIWVSWEPSRTLEWWREQLRWDEDDEQISVGDRVAQLWSQLCHSTRRRREHSASTADPEV
jgi:hypothetical protein